MVAWPGASRMSGMPHSDPDPWGVAELGWIGVQALREPEFQLPATAPGDGVREQRYLRLDVRGFAIGRQGLPAVLLRILLDPRTLGVLRWPLPDSIEAITVEPGRVVIRLAS